MPIYVAGCDCGRRVDYFRKVADHKDTPVCECGAKMRQLITATAIRTDLPPYQSPIDGREIRGRKARREDLIRNGCREYEGREQELKEAARIRAHKAQQLERKVDEQLEKTITDLDASNRLTRVADRSEPLPDFSGARIYGGT